MAQKVETHEDELEPRAREVLREIVVQYIEGGEPISSRSLAKGGRFSLSPASLRNVMADLEDSGYVFQPHTSAGRVPTDRGYRFFINHMMKSRRLSTHEREVIDDGVAQVNELDEVMHLASRLLAKLSDQVGVVFVPNLHHFAMRSIDLIYVSEARILCVIVGTNGVVVNRMLETGGGFTREDLEHISRRLTSDYAGLTLESVRDALARAANDERSRVDEPFRKSVALGIDAVEDLIPHQNELIVEGASSILNKPEFADARAMRKTFSAFEEKEKLTHILNEFLNEDGLQILVGSESQYTQNYNFSIVATRYGSMTTPFGMVGLIGPTRMEYARMATLVDYLGRALSRKIEETEQEQTS